MIFENPCVDNDFSIKTSFLIGKKKTLIGAIKLAKEYSTKNIIEYGTYIDDNCLEER